jgi:ribosomal protein L40E
VTILYSSDSSPVKGLPNVVLWIVDADTNLQVPGSNSESATTLDNGVINLYLRIPTDIDSGDYLIRAIAADQSYDSSTQITISAAGGEGLFPWWVWILIIVAVVGIVAGFTVYTYVYGLGKLVECGSCGAFIPAASKRCPKCGVEFEAGTMKCSECGAWISADSTECPTCGVKFVGETEAEVDYMDRMKKQYEETVVSKYRALAEAELGKKHNEKAFDLWWRSQPGFIAFEDWLAKEEEKKKAGPVACPVCGTLNPKEATVCHKCGTVFAAAGTGPGRRPPSAGAPPEEYEEAPQAEAREAQTPQAAPGAAPRMVIRRPIDRKVVPKKIIKTPVSGEESGESTETNEDQ